MITVVRSSRGSLIGLVFFSLILVGLRPVFVIVILLWFVLGCTVRGFCAGCAMIRPVFSLGFLIIIVKSPIIFSIPLSSTRIIISSWRFLVPWSAHFLF